MIVRARAWPRRMLTYLTYLAKKQGLLGFTAEVLYREMIPSSGFLIRWDLPVSKRNEAGIIRDESHVSMIVQIIFLKNYRSGLLFIS